MLKGILYSTNPERLDFIQATLIHDYQSEMLIQKICHPNQITEYLSVETPDFILFDIQTINQSLKIGRAHV